jgi:hypothetical protein
MKQNFMLYFLDKGLGLLMEQSRTSAENQRNDVRTVD